MSSEIIEKIETHILDLPLKRLHKFSATTINSKAYLVVRIYTKNGLDGLGEATTPGGPWWAGEAIETIKVMIDTYFTPALIGEDALEVNRLMDKLNRIAALNTFAKAAIEMALLDLKGKASDQPLYEFFGGLLRDSAVIKWPLALGDPEADIEEAERIMADNIAQDFKVKMGYMTPEDDVTYLAALCKGLCDRATVSGDLNAAWDEEQARKHLPALAENGMHMIEQPVQGWNKKAMARLCGLTTMPILADESIRMVHEANELAEMHAADGFSLKPLKSGGLYVTRRIAEIANAAGIGCYTGSFLETSIGTSSFMHLVAATPGMDFGNELVGPIWLADDIATEPVDYHDNRIWVKQGPGHGIILDEDKLNHYLRK